MATRTLKPLNRTITLLGASRILVGTSCWAAPATTARIFAMWTLPQATSVVVRTFGARDVMLGLWLLTSRSEEARRKAVYFGAAVDASDAFSCLMSWYTGDLPPSAALVAGAGALCVVAWARHGISHFKVG